MTSLSKYLEQFPLARTKPICLVLSTSDFRDNSRIDISGLRHTKRDWELSDKVIIVSSEDKKINKSSSALLVLKEKSVLTKSYDYVYRPDVLDYDLNQST
jgi:hypothetical protein